MSALWIWQACLEQTNPWNWRQNPKRIKNELGLLSASISTNKPLARWVGIQNLINALGNSGKDVAAARRGFVYGGACYIL